MCQLGSMCKWNWTGEAEKHEMVKIRRATRKIQLDPRTTYCRACTPVSEMLSSLQLLAATASPSHSFQGDALQRETLSIVYQHCPADLQLLVKTKRYSLQHSEQHNKNYKEDWSSPRFKGKSTKTLWHLLQASLQQKLHHGILEWLGLKRTLKIIQFQLILLFTTPGCSAHHSTWPWTSSGMRHLQFLWATCSASEQRNSSSHLI